MPKIIRIDESRQQDVFLRNEPFQLWGRMKPAYDGERWTYTTEVFEKQQVEEMVFPDENYDFHGMQQSFFFVGAYDDDDKCVGLAIYQRHFLKHLYLYDLKVNQAYRGQNIGCMLIEEGKKLASENGYKGLYTIGQDNNLSACLFYLKSGFVIGGLNTHVYNGTRQAGKSDIYFYFALS